MDSLPLTLIPQTPNAMPLLAKGLLAVKYFIVLQANGTSVKADCGQGCKFSKEQIF